LVTASKEEHMSPRRFLVELAVMGGAVSGAAIGFFAGGPYDAAVQVSLAFLGMSLGGAFVDICLRGGQ
jgi:hypothetical protein